MLRLITVLAPGSGQDSKQNVPISSVELIGSSAQETARLQGASGNLTSGNLTGEDGGLLLKAANLQNNADGANLTAASEPSEYCCAQILLLLSERIACESPYHCFVSHTEGIPLLQ